MINSELFITSLGSLTEGALLSLALAACTLVVGSIGGTLLSLMMVYGNTAARVSAHTFVTFIRGTPMLVQIMALFFVLPYLGIFIPAYLSAILAIGMNSAAYISQIMKAGIQSVGVGQIEAAQALGFSPVQTARLIVLPQTIRTVLPALGNECITLIKDSSLASVIGVAELTHQGSLIMNKTYDALTAYFGVALFYLCMTSCAALLVHFIERKIHYVKN